MLYIGNCKHTTMAIY